MRPSIPSVLVALGLLAPAADVAWARNGPVVIEVERNGVGGVTGLFGAIDLATSPDGLFVYAAAFADGAIAAFARDPATGFLSFVGEYRDGVAGIDGIEGTYALALSPDGAHVYVSGTSENAVAVFTRNVTTGVLGLVEVQRDGVGGVDGLARPVGLAVTPDGLHVYVAGANDDAIAIFSRNAGSGALTFVGTMPNGGPVSSLDEPTEVAVSPDGAHVYTRAGLTNATGVFARDAGTGLLTQVQNVGGSDPGGDIAFTSDGNCVLNAHGYSGVRSYLRDGTTGVLTSADTLGTIGAALGVAVRADDARVAATRLHLRRQGRLPGGAHQSRVAGRKRRHRQGDRQGQGGRADGAVRVRHTHAAPGRGTAANRRRAVLGGNVQHRDAERPRALQGDGGLGALSRPA
jgi:6-phosphogluconolactonase (cycloisomerase 2 family)